MFCYCPVTGVLTWRERDSKWFNTLHYCKAWNTRYSGKEAGRKFQGYLMVGVFGKRFFAHRIIWKLIYNSEPEALDHKNRQRADNRLDNLREANITINNRNKSIRKDNISGVNGVHWLAKRNKWNAEIKVDGKKKYLGQFVNKQDAEEARRVANVKYGFHKQHGS